MAEMSVVTEELEDCKLKINYTADSNVVEDKISDALNQLRELNVPGFRPGKATDAALKMKFKDRIEQWVKREMLNIAHEDVLYETKIRPISNPQIEKASVRGSNFSCEMVYMAKPEFELQDISSIEVPAPHMEKTESEIKEVFLQDLREKHGEVAPYEDGDFVQDKDKVTLTYELSNGTKEEGKLYVVGSKLFPDFDENIFGMAPDESRDFSVEINGEKVDCNVTLHMGMKKKPCALDDNLAKSCGLNTFDELKNTVEGIAKNQFKAARDSKIAEQLMNVLVDSHDFEPPAWLVNMDAQHLAVQEGLDWEGASDDVKSSLRARANKNVKFTLILDSVRVENKESELSDEESINGIKQMVAQRGVPDPDAWINSAMKSGTLHGLVAKAKNDFTTQWLVDKVKIVE